MNEPPKKNAPGGAATDARRTKLKLLELAYHFLGMLQTPFRCVFWWLQQRRDQLATRALRLGSDSTEKGKKS